jgi:hypothetical protein
MCNVERAETNQNIGNNNDYVKKPEINEKAKLS